MNKPEKDAKPVKSTPIGPPGITRQFRDIAITSQRGDRSRFVIDDPYPTTSAPERKRIVKELEAALNETETKAKGKRTRRPDKPWEAEGISKALWYRRRKAAEK